MELRYGKLSGSDNAFECRDWLDRVVRLTQKTFDAHVPRHPEIEEYLAEAQQTISDPDVVMEADNGATLIYRFGITQDRPFNLLYLMVAIYYHLDDDESIGTVATYFFTDQLSNSAALIEHRAQVIAGTRVRLSGGGD